jgi:hypothetical protein
LGRRHKHDSPEAMPRWDKQPRLSRGHPRAGQADTTHPRTTPGNTGSNNSLEATRAGKAAMIRPRESLGGRGSHDSLEAILEGRGSHDSPKAILGWERQSRLAPGHPQARDTITTRPRPSLSGTVSHNSPEAILG